jgi:hypothetical protein
MDETIATGPRAVAPWEPAGGPLSTPGRQAIRAARHRRAWVARRRTSGAETASAPAARRGAARPAARSSAARILSPAERERRRASVADALVRTIRSVPMPGVPPFSRRDRLLIVGFIAVEAIVAVLLGTAGRR